MPESLTNASAVKLVLKQGLGRGLLRWFQFRQSLQTSQWQSELESLKKQKKSTEQIFEHLLLSGEKQNLLHSAYWWFILLSAIVAIGAMSGALNYSGEAPVNLFLFLALFVALPFALSTATAVFYIFGSGKSNPFAALLGKYSYPKIWQLLNSGHVGVSNSTLIFDWLLLKAQYLAVNLQIFVIITFMISLILKDVAFGWSSTLVDDELAVTSFFEALTWPWRWMLASPDSSLVSASHFYHGVQEFDRALLGSWWSHLLLAMLFYGLLPRFILALIIYFQLKSGLIKNIVNSADLTRFISVVESTPSVSARMPAASLNESSGENIEHLPAGPPQNSLVFSWQYQQDFWSDIPVLGMSGWDEDQAWFNSMSVDDLEQVLVIVHCRQTPMAELQDFLEIISAENKALPCQINVVLDEQFEHSKKDEANILSWRIFCQQINQQRKLQALPEVSLHFYKIPRELI